MADDKTNRPDYLNQALQQGLSESAVPDETLEESAPATASYDTIKGFKRKATLVDLQNANGAHTALPYAYIMLIRYQAVPKEAIHIRTTHMDITLSGVHLKPLYDALYEQRVIYIREMPPPYTEKQTHQEPFVTTITLTDRH